MRDLMKIPLKMVAAFLVIIMGGMALTGCALTPQLLAGHEEPITNTSEQSMVSMTDTYRAKLVEDRWVYHDDIPDSIVHFYLTITEDNLRSDSPLTWAELNRIHNKDEDMKDKQMEAILQEGNAQQLSAGMFGYDAQHRNAVVAVRGNSTLSANQKSYKIKLYNEAGEWRNQRTINLIKHAYDSTRIRNKLSFDYFKLLPDFTSLRTQFVQLFVKDLTNGNPNEGFVDYGLFTQIEQPNKKFLKSHGLDPKGHLYKPNLFEFFRYADDLKLADDPEYNEANFETVIEIKGSKDHSKLLNMLDDVNNFSLNFDEVFDQHFDRDNFLTWIAVNVLMENTDTISQNYMLYSPTNSTTWFFLPWDYDDAWGADVLSKDSLEKKPPWHIGITKYWGSPLQQRFFKNPKNLQQLLDKIEELKTYINPKQTAAMIESYKPIVSPFVHRLPDLAGLSAPVARYDQELERLKPFTVEKERLFMESLEHPMPFFLGEEEWVEGALSFTWDNSYDLQGDDITYHFRIGKDPSLADPIEDLSGLTVTTVYLKGLTKGHYYWEVIARDSRGNEMPAFDIYEDMDDVSHFGMKDFYVD